MDKIVNTGRSIALGGKKETVQISEETRQNLIVDETPRVVRPVRDDHRMKSLFDGPAARAQELSTE